MVMRNWYPNRQRVAAVAGILAVMLAIAAGAGNAFAQSADDDDVPLDTKLFRKFMKQLGFRNSDVGVEYHERAPLVVPPSRNLPPPQDEAPVARDPAWPKDPDVARRKEATAAEKAKLRRSSGDTPTEDARALRPDELKGQPATAAAATGPARPSGEEAGRPLDAAQMGAKKNWLESMWSVVGPQKPETAPFTGEPPRTSMTDPPPGYQVPSPNQPYGVGVTWEKAKAPTLESRMEAPH
jgi:hypothetical protein